MWPSLNIMYNVAIPKYYHKKVVSLNTNVAIHKYYITRRWFSLNATRPCGYFQGCKRAPQSCELITLRQAGSASEPL